MKRHLSLALAVFAAIASTLAPAADSTDVMLKKIFGAKKPPSFAPYALTSHALVSEDNTIALNAWGSSLVASTSGNFTTSLAFTAPTANRTITFPNSSGTVALNPYGASIEFEGATADAYETTLAVVDPTADQTYKLPNVAAGTYSLVMSTLATNGLDAANSVWGASNAIVFEGATANAYETSVVPTDPTADRTITLPDASGTVRVAQASTTTALTADNQAVTPGSANVLQLTSDDATATNRTFTLSATGAITGAIYILIGPATNQCEIAVTGIQKLSATWSPTALDTLTLLFNGTNFIELARSNN